MINNQHSKRKKNHPLTEEELESLTDFIMALRGLIDDALRQGYTVENGEWIPPKVLKKSNGEITRDSNS